MVYLVMMIFAGLFGLVYSFKTTGYARTLSWVFVAAIGISSVQVAMVALDGYYLFALATLGVIVYAFSFSEFTTAKKMIIAAIGLVSAVPLLLWLNVDSRFGHHELGWISLVTLVLYIYVLVKEIKMYKEEIGFLTILAMDALVRVLVFLSAQLAGPVDQAAEVALL